METKTKGPKLSEPMRAALLDLRGQVVDKFPRGRGLVRGEGERWAPGVWDDYRCKISRRTAGALDRRGLISTARRLGCRAEHLSTRLVELTDAGLELAEILNDADVGPASVRLVTATSILEGVPVVGGWKELEVDLEAGERLEMYPGADATRYGSRSSIDGPARVWVGLSPGGQIRLDPMGPDRRLVDVYGDVVEVVEEGNCRKCGEGETDPGGVCEWCGECSLCCDCGTFDDEPDGQAVEEGGAR
jgi:hypothetical protein